MNDIKDGGPAFPYNAAGQYSTGMTLRDWFAGQALAALLTQPTTFPTAEEDAARAYKFADAMLKAREVKP